MAAAKIQGMLASAIQKLEAKPTTLLDLVATTSADVAALRRYIAEHGGEIVKTDADSVQLRLPVAEVRGLAESGLVSALRMARLQRLHG